MLTMKYLLEVAGFVLMAAAAAMLLHDLFRLYQQSNLILNDQPRPAVIEPRYRAAGRIAALGLTHFIDDLEEVLTDPDFPPQIKRILLAEGTPDTNAPYVRCPTWQSIEELVFGPA